MKGIYALVIHLEKDVIINVGALGETEFKKGLYVYVGSAQTNLEQRVKRHLRRNKRLFWHIDYLLNTGDTKIEKVFFKEAGKTEECALAGRIEKLGEAVAGFGCSDCRCRSHLFQLGKCRVAW